MCGWQSEDCGPFFSDTKAHDPSICPTAFQWWTTLVHREWLPKQWNRSSISPSIHSVDHHWVPWCASPYSGTGNEEAILFPYVIHTLWVEQHGECEPDSWDHILTLSLASCVTLDMLPNFSEPQFIHLNRGYLPLWLLWSLNELIFIQHLEHVSIVK